MIAIVFLKPGGSQMRPAFLALGATVCTAGLLLGGASVAQAQQPSETCIPNPLQPGACLGIGDLIPGMSRRPDRSTPRGEGPRVRTRSPGYDNPAPEASSSPNLRNQLTRARTRGAPQPSQSGAAPTAVGRSSAPPAAPSTGRSVGAAAGAILKPGSGPSTSPKASAAPAPSTRSTSTAPPSAAAQQRANARKKATEPEP